MCIIVIIIIRGGGRQRLVSERASEFEQVDLAVHIDMGCFSVEFKC